MTIGWTGIFYTDKTTILEQKIDDVKRNAESVNKGYQAVVTIVNSKNDEDLGGSIEHVYMVELIHKDDLKENI